MEDKQTKSWRRHRPSLTCRRSAPNCSVLAASRAAGGPTDPSAGGAAPASAAMAPPQCGGPTPAGTHAATGGWHAPRGGRRRVEPAGPTTRQWRAGPRPPRGPRRGWRRSLRLWLTAGARHRPGGPVRALIRGAARRRCVWNLSPVVPWGGATFLGDEAQRGGAGVDDTDAAAAAHKARPRPPSPPPRHRRVRARPLAWRNSVAAGVAVDGAKTVSWPLPAPFGGSCQGRTLPPLQLRPLSPWLPAPPAPWRCTRRRHRRRHRRPRHHQLH